MFYVDSYSNSSKLLKCNPILKIFYFVLFFVLSWFSNSLLYSCLLLVIVFGSVLFCSSELFVKFLRISFVPLLFVLIGVFPIVLIGNNLKDSLFDIPVIYYGITSASLLIGAKIFLRSYICSSALLFFVLTTPLGHLLFMLRKFKVPEILIDLISLIYRNIFVVIFVTQQFFIAQKSRLAYFNWRRNYRQFAQLLSISFVFSIKRVLQQHNALESRCYTGSFCVIDPEYDATPFFAKVMILIALGLCIAAYASFYFKWL